MHKKILIIGLVVLSLFLWTAHAVVGSMYHQDLSFIESLITSVPTPYLVFRFSMIFILGGFCSYFLFLIRKNENSTEKIEIEIPDGIRKLAEEDPHFLLDFLHKIRMQLNNVLGFADLLRSNELEKTVSDRYFGYIETSKQSTFSAVDELISSLKIGGGKVLNKTDDYLEIINWKEKKILIAEDVETNFILLKAVLQKTGMELLWARDGAEALKLFRKNKDLDLILMDILMPEMDGFEATKEIRKVDTKIPIIAQTAYNFDWTTVHKEGLGFNDFIAKPIGHYDLILKLYRYLE